MADKKDVRVHPHIERQADQTWRAEDRDAAPGVFGVGDTPEEAHKALAARVAAGDVAPTAHGIGKIKEPAAARRYTDQYFKDKHGDDWQRAKHAAAGALPAQQDRSYELREDMPHTHEMPKQQSVDEILKRKVAPEDVAPPVPAPGASGRWADDVTKSA